MICVNFTKTTILFSIHFLLQVVVLVLLVTSPIYYACSWEYNGECMDVPEISKRRRFLDSQNFCTGWRLRVNFKKNPEIQGTIFFTRNLFNMDF